MVTEAYFQCSLRTKNVKTVFSQLVKFGTEISIWMKLIKIFFTEEELDMETLIWIFFLARSKIFRLHAILHDSAGAVKTTTEEGPD